MRSDMENCHGIDEYPQHILEKARGIQLLILDVDGVMTDGSIIYSEKGEELKVFNAQDGHGIKMLLLAGISVALITGRASRAVTVRAENLGITDVYLSSLRKIEAYEDLLMKKRVVDKDVCVVGDDLPDVPLLSRCGLAVAVPDSVSDVLRCADYVTKHQGGRGAVREVCELLLKANGLWSQVTKRYFII